MIKRAKHYGYHFTPAVIMKKGNKTIHIKVKIHKKLKVQASKMNKKLNELLEEIIIKYWENES